LQARGIAGFEPHHHHKVQGCVANLEFTGDGGASWARSAPVLRSRVAASSNLMPSLTTAPKLGPFPPHDTRRQLGSIPAPPRQAQPTRRRGRTLSRREARTVSAFSRRAAVMLPLCRGARAPHTSGEKRRLKKLKSRAEHTSIGPRVIP
jgi:hypothetical protein